MCIRGWGDTAFLEGLHRACTLSSLYVLADMFIKGCMPNCRGPFVSCSMRERVSVCVCVYVCTQAYPHACIFICMCVCPFVCVEKAIGCVGVSAFSTEGIDLRKSECGDRRAMQDAPI